jgi:hypothetical protein
LPQILKVSLTIMVMTLRAVVLLILGLATACLQPSAAQTPTVRGFVTDASNSQPLPGATVVLEATDGTLRGELSDGDGVYVIVGVPPGRYTFRVSFVGYTPHVDTLVFGAETVLTRNVALALAEGELEEVVVRAEGGSARLEAGLVRATAADISRIPTPGATGDLAGYLQSLPGVVTIGDRGGQLYVRGGTPTQNLVLTDGMLIYQPFHIVGFFSSFPEDLISNVDIYAGGFGARYTGRLSSVVDVSLRGGNFQRFQGAASVSPFLGAVRVEGPVQRGKISILGSVRTSLIERTAPVVLREDLPMSYSDMYVKLEGVGDFGRCSLSGLRTFDRGSIDPARGEEFTWNNAVMGGRCILLVPGSGTSVEITSGFSVINNKIGAEGSPDRSAQAWRHSSEAHFTHPYSNVTYQWGLWLGAEDMDYLLNQRFFQREFFDGRLLNVGGYWGARIPVPGNVELDPSIGLTGDFHFGFLVEPRLRVYWRPGGAASRQISAAVGVYRQYIEGITDERDAGTLFTVWLPADENTSPRAFHALLGGRQTIGRFDFSIEGFFKRAYDVPVPVWSRLANFTTQLTSAEGRIHGFDIRTTYNSPKFYAFAGYGYSWTKYFGLFGDVAGGAVQSYQPPHDLRHQVSVVLGVTPGPFEVNVRWQFGSGLPYSPPYGIDSMIRWPKLEEGIDDYGIPRLLLEQPYAGRLPAYHRLDISVGKEFTTRLAVLAVQAGAINVYDRANPFYIDLLLQKRVDQFPVIPYLTLELKTR